YLFFQAEDGIRERNVTGVQTCALPISTTMSPSVVPEPALPPPAFFPLPLPLLAPPSAPAPSLSVTSEVVVILTSVTRPLASLVIDIDMPWTDPVPPVLRPIWPVSSEVSC